MRYIVSTAYCYNEGVGFALWIQDAGTAWAQGTHEYKPMGTAVIALSDQFRARDFSRARRSPSRTEPSFIGLFASIEDVNRFLRRRQQSRKPLRSRRPDRLAHPYL